MSLIRVEEIISEQGSNILDKICSSYITVVEKLSGSSFYMKNTNDEKIFYRQTINNPINLVDRTLNKLWNEPLTYLEKFDSLTIPDNWVFKFEWFYSDCPQGLQYSRKPKNGLILTGIWDHKNNLVTDLSEYQLFNDYFSIEAVPLLWEGTMNDEQKDRIKQFASTTFDALIPEFGTDSFIRNFLNVLNPNIKGCLQDKPDQHIEGVIIKFINNPELDDLVLVDQIFEEITKKIKINRSREPKTIYSLILVDILHWFNESNILNVIPIKGDNMDQRYLNLIIDVWKKFIDECGPRYLGLDFQLPKDLLNNIFRINDSHINDPIALKLMYDNREYENLLQIFLAAFRKKRKNPIGVLSDDLLIDFNQTIDIINSRIISIYESRLPSYNEFKLMQNMLSPSLEENIEDEVIQDEDDTEKEVLDVSVENSVKREVSNIDTEVGVQDEPIIQEPTEDTIDSISKITPVVIDDVIPIVVNNILVVYNQRVPSKKLLTLLSSLNAQFDKKIFIYIPNGLDRTTVLTFSKFISGYSSLVETISSDYLIETTIKNLNISHIFIDQTEDKWFELILTSLSIPVIRQTVDIYEDSIEKTIITEDYVAFKSLVPEIIEKEWLSIISLKTPIE